MDSNLDLKIDNMYSFVKGVFKEGLTPPTKEDFIKSLSTETTDGSLCMAYDFGDRQKDETTMLFFREYDCIIPYKYEKHLKDKYRPEGCLFFLQLDYMYACAASSDNEEYLTGMQKSLENKRLHVKSLVESRIQVYSYMGVEKTALTAEMTPFAALSNFDEEANKVNEFIQNRLEEVSSSSEENI